MPNYYALADRSLALLVTIFELHKKGYMEIPKTLLAYTVKNIDLRNWYPERRELPRNDPYHAINPWFDGIFKEDLPLLIEAGFIEERISKGAGFVKLTEHGKILACQLSNLPQYASIGSQINELIVKINPHPKKFTKTLLESLRFYGKHVYKDEAKIYSLEDGSKFPLILAVDTKDPNKITAYIDVKEWGSSVLKSLMNKIKNEEILRATHNESQWDFLFRYSSKYA